MSTGLQAALEGQQQRNRALLDGVSYLGDSIESQVLPLRVDIGGEALSAEQVSGLEGLQIEAADDGGAKRFLEAGDRVEPYQFALLVAQVDFG